MLRYAILGGSVLLIAIIIGSIYLSKYVQRQNALKAVYQSLVRISSDSTNITVNKDKKKPYDFVLKYNNKTIIFDVIYHFSCDEINVNSREYWQRNRKPTTSRNPSLKMENIYGLLNYSVTRDGFPMDSKKVYIIYPYARNLMKVINECEMIFIYPKTDVYGVQIVNFMDLESKIDEI